MAHATVRATILPEIVRLISKHKNVTELEAMDMFYNSATGSCFSDDSTGLYGQSALYVFGLFMDEVK